MRHSGLSALGLLWMMMMAVVSSVMVHVHSVRYITGPIRCIKPDDILNVYRECEGKDGIDVLFTFHCGSNSVKFCKPGILLNTSSHCWTHLDAGNDSCVYKTGYHNPGITDFTIDVRVLDRVLIFNITMNQSCLGLDMAVRVHYSAGAVTWEVDGEPFPKGYRLIDDNRTLIIPSVQRDDAKRRFQVRITNPVIDDTWNCQLAIGVSDPVLLFNITCNSSRLGEDMDMSVLLSEEDKAVDWVPLSEKYQLMADNGTLRDDAKRRSGVGITITIPEETWNYWRKDRDYEADGRNRGVTAAILVVAVLIIIMGIIYMIRRKCSRNRIPKTKKDVLYTPVSEHNGSVPTVTERNEPEAILIQNGSVPSVTERNEPEAILIQNGSVPAVTEYEEPEAIIHNWSLPAVAPRMHPVPPLSSLESQSHTSLCRTQTDL